VQQSGRRRIRRMRRLRSTWVCEWLSEDRSQQLGHYSTFLTRELCTEDVNAFQNHLRMPPELFDEILERVTPCSHRETRHKVPLCPTTWTITHHSPMRFGAVKQPSDMVPELCRAIVEAYKDEVFAVSVTPSEWRALGMGQCPILPSSIHTKR